MPNIQVFSCMVGSRRPYISSIIAYRILWPARGPGQCRLRPAIREPGSLPLRYRAARSTGERKKRNPGRTFIPFSSPSLPDCSATPVIGAIFLVGLSISRRPLILFRVCVRAGKQRGLRCTDFLRYSGPSRLINSIRSRGATISSRDYRTWSSCV